MNPEPDMNNVVSERLAGVIDALKAHVCVVDRDGLIVATNRAWREFAARNDAAGTDDREHRGVNYLDVCQGSAGLDSEEAPAFFDGMRAVLDGAQDLFEMEYPCHAPGERRWFRACVTPLWRTTLTDTGMVGAIVSHVNVTDKKLAEQAFTSLWAGKARAS
jgi:PAS domain-containing protein